MLALRSRWTALFVCASLACAPPPKPKSLASAQTPAPTRENAPLIPRAVLFGDPERSEVRLSPDGKFLSWLAAVDGVLNIWVAPADNLARAHAVSADRARPVQHYDWTFDSEHLVYSQDTAGDENFHLFRVRASGGDVTDLTPLPGTRAELYALSEQKPELATVGLNARDPHVFDVYQLDLRNGQRELVLRNDQGYSAFQFDHALTLRFAQRLLDDGSVAWFSRDRATGAWVPYDHIAQEDALTTSMFGFDRSGASFFAMDSRGRNTGALMRVDASSKQSSLLWADARADINHVLFHPVEHTVQAALIDYDRPYWVSLDRDVQRDLHAISRLEADGGTPFISSRTLDDSVWLVYLEQDHKSPKFYRWTRATQKAELLFSVQPALDRQRLVKFRPVVIPARDGLPLLSYLSLPAAADPDDDGQPETPLPLVLVVHGGPWGRDEWGFNRLHQLLANRGYAALSVNFRGSTGFGKDFVDRGDRQWGKRMQDDLLDAVSWAKNRRIAAADKICIMGGSYGGYATLAALSLTPEVFACGIDQVGPSNLVTLLQSFPPYWKPLLAMFRARVGDESTESGRRELLEVSPVTHADQIKRPLLIAQGQNDPRVKRRESEQIVAALRENGTPVSYVVFPDEGHGFAKPANNIVFYGLAEAFLAQHLGGRYELLSADELHKSSLRMEAGREHVLGGQPYLEKAGAISRDGSHE